MRPNKALAALTLLVAAALTVRSSAQTMNAGPFVAGEILVTFRPGANANARADAHRTAGAAQLAEIPRTGVHRVRVPAQTGIGSDCALPAQPERPTRSRTSSAACQAHRPRRAARWCPATITLASSGRSTTPVNPSTAFRGSTASCASTAERLMPTSTPRGLGDYQRQLQRHCRRDRFGHRL